MDKWLHVDNLILIAFALFGLTGAAWLFGFPASVWGWPLAIGGGLFAFVAFLFATMDWR